MKIIVDGDSSPVLNLVTTTAKEYGLELLIVKNYNHNIESDYGVVVTVDNIKEAADLYIANHIEKGDILVTQDYGLASIVLGKSTYVINPSGKILDDSNIDLLLNQRHINKELRQKHNIYSKFKKRDRKDNISFEDNLIYLIEKGLEF